MKIFLGITIDKEVTKRFTELEQNIIRKNRKPANILSDLISFLDKEDPSILNKYVGVDNFKK